MTQRDSISQGFPIPIILLAEVGELGNVRLEIIDGMQRLNAIMSFIEQEFSINGKYFDLETIAEAKEKLDKNELVQKDEKLSRSECVEFAGYHVPVSIYTEREAKHIDEVFKRLNANGKHLSKQELRQAGSTGAFANVVRKISSNIRGDSSGNDVLPLNKMKNISITNRDLPYGIDADSVFWVKNKILNREDLRNSKDEEVMADIVAWIISDKAMRSSSDVLDNYYGFGGSNELSQAVDRQIAKHGEEFIINNVQYCIDVILDLIRKANKDLRSILFNNNPNRFPRHFQLFFLAIYEQIFENGKEVDNYSKLISHITNSGNSVTLSEGGGNWSSVEKDRAINQISGIIQKDFKKSGQIDPSKKHWVSRFENIIMNSTTEQTLYDFKMGFYELRQNAKFDQKLFDKCIKTLTSMANTNKGSIGYVIIGVSDKITTAKSYTKQYGTKCVNFGSYYVNGVDDEAGAYEKDTDTYFTKLTNLIKSQPISERDKDYLGRNIFTIKYYDKTVIIASLSTDADPCIYDNKYYTRFGSNVEEVKTKDLAAFFKRFS